MPDAGAQRVQAYLRTVVELKREIVPAGAFTLFVDPHATGRFRNYAIPQPASASSDGRELIAAARARDRTPRLEYIEECFPWVADALAPDGFVLEGRHPLMVCARDALTPAPAPVDLLAVAPGSELVGGLLRAQHAAFGDAPPDDAAIARFKLAAVAALHDGEVVGGAAHTEIIDGMTELVGIAVTEPFRRRGIGAALTAAIAQAAFDAGAELAMLTPGDEDTARVYARVGLAPVATMVHLIAA